MTHAFPSRRSSDLQPFRFVGEFLVSFLDPSGEVNMPKLTKSVVDNSPTRGSQYTIWCSELKGFGAFIMPSGTRTYFVDYRNANRSEAHTSELQSLLRLSYAVFCLQKNTTNP